MKTVHVAILQMIYQHQMENRKKIVKRKNKPAATSTIYPLHHHRQMARATKHIRKNHF